MENEKKKFKFKIRVKAEHHNGTKSGVPTFIDAANDWYNTVGKASLKKYFDERALNDYSHLNSFTFGDSVDKETYD